MLEQIFIKSFENFLNETEHLDLDKYEIVVYEDKNIKLIRPTDFNVAVSKWAINKDLSQDRDYLSYGGRLTLQETYREKVFVIYFKNEKNYNYVVLRKNKNFYINLYAASSGGDNIMVKYNETDDEFDIIKEVQEMLDSKSIPGFEHETNAQNFLDNTNIKNIDYEWNKGYLYLLIYNNIESFNKALKLCFKYYGKEDSYSKSMPYDYRNQEFFDYIKQFEPEFYKTWKFSKN